MFFEWQEKLIGHWPGSGSGSVRKKKNTNRCLSFPHASQELFPNPEEDAEKVFEKHGEADHAVPARVNSAKFLR